MVMKPCLGCGDLAEQSRCEPCRLEHERPLKAQHERDRDRLSPRERGYDAAWVRLSKRARAMQSYCTDCGATEDLTADHLPEAWQAKAEGRAITLRMVEVVCAVCNSRRGSSRPGSLRATA